MHTDTPRGVRPYGRSGAAALAALSVLATGGAVIGAPGIANAASIAVDAFVSGDAVAQSAPIAMAAKVRPLAGPVLPASTGPALETQSQLSADRAIILSGQSIVLVGRITYGSAGKPFRSQPVRLEEGTGATWKTVGNALANPDGSVTYTVKPTKSTSYRLSYVGARTFGGSSSAVQSVTVKAPPPPPPVVRTARASSPASSSSSGGSWAPAGVSQIGSNGRVERQRRRCGGGRRSAER